MVVPSARDQQLVVARAPEPVIAAAVGRDLGLDVLARARVSLVPDTTSSTEEVTTTDTIPALSA